MLHPWNKAARLIIDSDQVAASSSVRGKPIQEVISIIKEIPGTPVRYENIATAVSAALTDLSNTVTHPFYKVDVQIADSFVFYDVLAIDARIISALELRRVAGLGLADTLGLDPADLMIRCAIQKGGMSVVICGIPIALLNAIERAIQQVGYRLNRIEPAFAEFVNWHASRLILPNAMIARLRHHSLTLGLMRDGKWHAFATERLSQRIWTELRDSCDAFCSRISIPDHHHLPILFDVDIDEIPTDASGRWQPLLLTPTQS